MHSAKYPIGFDGNQNKSTPFHYYLSQAVIGNRLPRGEFFKKPQQIMRELSKQLFHAHPQLLSVLDEAYNEYLDLSGVTSVITKHKTLYTEHDVFPNLHAQYPDMHRFSFNKNDCLFFMRKQYGFSYSLCNPYIQFRNFILK